MTSRLLAGLVAGAAGTTALNTVTYFDMVARARPSSTTPEDTVRTVQDTTGLSLADAGPDSDEAGARRTGLGALLGIASGLATGAMYGLARPLLAGVPAPVRGLLVGLAANVATTGPMAAAGVTDLREWQTDSGSATWYRTWPTDWSPPRSPMR